MSNKYKNLGVEI